MLVTRFLSAGGVVEVTDYMPMEDVEKEKVRHGLMRCVRGLRGQMGIRIECSPAFDYGRAAHRTRLVKDGAIFETDQLRLGLYSSVPLSIDDKAAATEISVHEEAEIWLSIGVMDEDEDSLDALKSAAGSDSLSYTSKFWRRWVSQCIYAAGGLR